MKYRLYIKFACVYLLSVGYIWAQNESIISITSKNGLPTNDISCIYKDKYGFYWIGGKSGGLCKYDGYEIERLNKDTSLLKCSYIRSICGYKDYVIIACDMGVLFYDYIKNTFFKIPEIQTEVKDVTIYKLYVHGDMLFLLFDNGMLEYHFQTKKITHYEWNEEDKEKNDKIDDYSTLFLDNNYFLLVGNQAIRRIDTIKHLILSSIQIRDVKYTTSMNIIRYGKFWYITTIDKVVKVDLDSLEKIEELPLKQIIKDANITKIISIVSVKNKIYIGCNRGMIIEYDPLKHTANLIQTTDNIDELYLYNIDNNLVILTQKNGILIFPLSMKKFNTPVSTEIAKYVKDVYMIYEYSPGKILLGGNNKMLLYNILNDKIEKDYSHLFNTPPLCATHSYEKDKLYIGTWGDGLRYFDVKKGSVKQIKLTNQRKDILSLLMDNNDTLWCGTLEEGLIKYNVKTAKDIEMKILEGNTITHIQKVNDGYWIGTLKNGLYKIDFKNRITLHLNTANKKLNHNSVYYSLEDSNYVYIGTEIGFNIYDKKKDTSYFYSEVDGLCSTPVFSIYKDNKGNIWLHTTKGINKMILNRIHQPQLKLFYTYSFIDGLVNTEYYQTAHTVLKNGFLVYGGYEGIDIFNPSKIRSSFDNTPVYVVGFRKNGKEYPLDSNVIVKRYFEIDWRQNNIQIEVIAINPFVSSKTLYKYKLVGYDDEFSEPTDVRYLSYTGLPGGTYTLLIYATNKDGEWNTQPYYIYINVIPPFWKTPWFLITSSVLLFGGIIGFNQYRTYQIKKRNKELEQKVKERTKELAEKNQEILSSIQYAQRIQQAILPTYQYVQSVLSNAFILYLPKDIVSGDFYWIYEYHQVQTHTLSKIVAVVDCTGHGVPGALMSMIGNNLLNQIVIEKHITRPDIILNEMNKGVQMALKQGHSEIRTNDGMDASILVLHPDGNIQWAGAYRPIVIIKYNGQIQKIEGDKYPIGGVQINPDRQYTLHTLQIEKGDAIYLFSDGYADQFGGDKGKKMMMKRFVELLQQVHTRPVNEQKQILEQFFYQWKGSHDQVDDVLVIGIIYQG